MDHRYRKLLAVAEMGSFSAAAQKLHVSQPAITLAVGSLERAFGVKLCVRQRHAVSLTAEGEIVARAARKIAQEIAAMETQLHQASTTDHYQVGIIDSIAHLLYTSPKQRRLLSNIEVMVDNSRRILNNLLAEKIDVGLITGQPTSPGEGIIVHKLHDEEFVFVCVPSLAPASSVTHIDNWLAINQDSTTYRHFIKMFKKRGITAAPIFYSTSMELLKDMALSGEGTALLPRHLVLREITNGQLQIVQTQPLSRPIWAVTRKTGKPEVLPSLTAQIDELLAAGNA